MPSCASVLLHRRAAARPDCRYRDCERGIATQLCQQGTADKHTATSRAAAGFCAQGPWGWARRRATLSPSA